ncbi:hypothetical protein [Sporosarcina sp. FA9]|uniref:hypothetical protein n=1 Tax=Sporosarcina sp. FA9 TaxID=3413030 RepID=UPI003F65E27A
MLNKSLISTSIFAALLMAFALKSLHFFMFISWSPVGWSKKWNLFTADHRMHYFVNWMLLIVALTILFAIVYILTSFLYKVPPSILSLIIGVTSVVVIEWFIGKPVSLKETFLSISLPFIAIVLIVLRFLVGTAVFMKRIMITSSK